MFYLYLLSENRLHVYFICIWLKEHTYICGGFQCDTRYTSQRQFYRRKVRAVLCVELSVGHDAVDNNDSQSVESLEPQREDVFISPPAFDSQLAWFALGILAGNLRASSTIYTCTHQVPVSWILTRTTDLEIRTGSSRVLLTFVYYQYQAFDYQPARIVLIIGLQSQVSLTTVIRHCRGIYIYGKSMY